MYHTPAGLAGTLSLKRLFVKGWNTHYACTGEERAEVVEHIIFGTVKGRASPTSLCKAVVPCQLETMKH
jgi:hypothetical protein